jgi:MoaA/NifB/PqqE/SkfB family radical SAM enzyme
VAKVAILYIAERCNQSCVFCLEEDGTWRTFVDPTTAEAQAEIGRLWDRGARHITFMGGETFFRKDLGRLLGHARHLGYTRVGVTTNGSILSKRGFIKGLVDSGLSFIELSIHGHTQELSAAISGAAFTFDRQAAAMAELDEIGTLMTIVNVVVCRENVQHLVDVVRYVSETFPRIPARFKLKFVSLQGLAADRGNAIRYDEVDFAAVAEYVVPRGKRVSFYNVPLCRLGPHAHRSAELGSLAFDEQYFDFEHRGDAEYYESGYQLEGRVWPESKCGGCSLRPVCPGVEETHRRVHGDGMLSPRSDDPLPILRQALTDRGADPGQAEARLEALRREPRPSRFLRARPDGAIRFVHPHAPEPLDVLVELKASPPRPAFTTTARFTLSYRSWSDEDPAGRPDVAGLLSSAARALTQADSIGETLVGACEAVARAEAPGWSSQWSAPRTGAAAPGMPATLEAPENADGNPRRRGLPLMPA